ncbi:aminoglycoside phosphotransferase family protein [Streptomyces sp. 150FB]|uniref:aminoglycoside phosphotransferase family protein n=1 Tax=Streptomyces sp. 150FB TaxID=1576605 RepID=UPI00099C256D|nr:aminoglycoside phosphotransferase family protein [Streptomyces sp. 150FB]
MTEPTEPRELTELTEPTEPTRTEVPLTGGRITTGVVRVGDTVRRPVSDASRFVADLLGALARSGFAGAPRHLGLDEKGRDTFGYLPGRVPPRFRRWSDPQVAAAAALLRSFHDATRESGLTGGQPVVCHHDPGPNNTVFGDEDELPFAFIDFDMAAPGDPLEDLGYLAWTWCVSSRSTAPPVREQAVQVRIVAQAYGGRDAGGRHGSYGAELVDAMLDRQARNARWWRHRVAEDSAAVERIAWSEREYAFTAAHRTVFADALSRDPSG